MTEPVRNFEALAVCQRARTLAKDIDDHAHVRIHGDIRRIGAMLGNHITHLRSSALKGPKHVPMKISRDGETMLENCRSDSPPDPDIPNHGANPQTHKLLKT